VVLADPPYEVDLAIPYTTLEDDILLNMPFELVQDDGFIFLWVISSKLLLGLHILEKHHYRFVDWVVWVKETQAEEVHH
jgi:mRNA (2'-O-methyladenosine-N6-)-methyltransferase